MSVNFQQEPLMLIKNSVISTSKNQRNARRATVIQVSITSNEIQRRKKSKCSLPPSAKNGRRTASHGMSIAKGQSLMRGRTDACFPAEKKRAFRVRSEDSGRPARVRIDMRQVTDHSVDTTTVMPQEVVLSVRQTTWRS